MEPNTTPVENYTIKVLELLMAYGRKQLSEDHLLTAVVKLKNECIDAEKREHQNWFNKGFEFYHAQLIQKTERSGSHG
jgi:hypothetical protein